MKLFPVEANDGTCMINGGLLVNSNGLTPTIDKGNEREDNNVEPTFSKMDVADNDPLNSTKGGFFPFSSPHSLFFLFGNYLFNILITN